MTKKISLSQGKHALVDDEYYEELNKHKWYASKDWNSYYAKRNTQRVNSKRSIISMHRQILGLSFDDKKVADHKNRDSLDNRKVNLRIVSTAENSRNHGGHSNNTSGHTGVDYRKKGGKWRARIKVNYQYIHLGVYLKIEDAIKARQQGELDYWGETRQTYTRKGGSAN